MVKNEKQQHRCLKKLRERSIDIGNIEWIMSKRNYSYAHTRDWGPYTLKNKEKFSLVDGKFRSYPYCGYDSEKSKLHWLSDILPFLNTKYDNEAPGRVAEHFDVKREALPIALTGGAAMFDGRETLFVCRLVIDENRALGHSFEDFTHLLSTQLGIKRLIVLPNYRRAGIQHIDCLLKLLDEKRILLKRLDRSHRDYQRVEQIAEGLSQLRSLDGQQYEVIRIDTPNYRKNKSAPYTNSLIFNDKIFVPLKNIPGDKQALKTWQAAMPAHKVIGFRVEKWMRPWNFTDALHCRTKAIFILDNS
jgi:agmatine/peptidylarginine deiminase